MHFIFNFFFHCLYYIYKTVTDASKHQKRIHFTKLWHSIKYLSFVCLNLQMMAPMPSKSPAKRPAFMLSVTETDSASTASMSTPTSSSGEIFESDWKLIKFCTENKSSLRKRVKYTIWTIHLLIHNKQKVYAPNYNTDAEICVSREWITRFNDQ